MNATHSRIGPKTRSMLWLALFLVLAECGLRAVESAQRPVPLEIDAPPIFLLGTSRTERGIDPYVVESALLAEGAGSYWVASVTAHAVRCVGLEALYREQIRPRLAGVPEGGLVAIELYGAGMNDGVVFEAEREWLAGRSRRSSPLEPLGWPSRLANWSRGLLASLRLADARDLFVEFPLTRFTRTWMNERRGFHPHPNFTERGMRRSHWEPRYRNELLREWGIGGIQTVALRELVAAIRQDGLRVALYTMPISDMHRSFYPDGAYKEYKEGIRSFAAEEGLPLLDLDAGHGLKRTQFYDTHHLCGSTAPLVSRRLARGLAIQVGADTPR